MSIFLGDDLEEILECIDKGTSYKNQGAGRMEIGVHVLPSFPKDTTDRNRTSPFAFTGNKFEFRSCGSSMSVSGPNTILNTIVAEELRQFADELEQADDFTDALNDLIKRTIHEHKRIIFNGDGYSEEWKKEAHRRGLLNLPTTVDAMPTVLDRKNIELFERHHIYTEPEVRSRYEIQLDVYSKTINIEALTMIEMARRQILPAVNKYVSRLAQAVTYKQTANPLLQNSFEKDLLNKLSTLEDKAYAQVNDLQKLVDKAPSYDSDNLKCAVYYKDKIIPAMNKLRSYCDEMEVNTASDVWPFPTYGELLFSV